MTDEERWLRAVNLAGRYAALCRRLEAVVGWCVDHEQETLFNHPRVLEIAKRVLADARAQRWGVASMVDRLLIALSAVVAASSIALTGIDIRWAIYCMLGACWIALGLIATQGRPNG